MNVQTMRALATHLEVLTDRYGRMTLVARVWFDLKPWPSGRMYSYDILKVVREWNNDQ